MSETNNYSAAGRPVYDVSSFRLGRQVLGPVDNPEFDMLCGSLIRLRRRCPGIRVNSSNGKRPAFLDEINPGDVRNASRPVSNLRSFILAEVPSLRQPKQIHIIRGDHRINRQGLCHFSLLPDKDSNDSLWEETEQIIDVLEKDNAEVRRRTATYRKVNEIKLCTFVMSQASSDGLLDVEEAIKNSLEFDVLLDGIPDRLSATTIQVPLAKFKSVNE